VLNRGPFTLALSVPQTFIDPATYSENSANVQIQNTSAFQLSITTDGQQYSISPFFSQTVPCSEQGSVTIDPISQTLGLAGNTVTLVWLLPNEQSPQVDGALTTGSFATGDVLASESTSTILFNGSSPGNYQSFLVSLSITGAVATPPSQYIDILVGNFTAQTNVGRRVPIKQYVAIGPTTVYNESYYIPVYASQGDLISILVEPSFVSPAVTATVVALREPAPIQIRSDTRPVAIGEWSTQQNETATGGPTNLIAPPSGPGARILLAQVGISGGNPVFTGNIAATLNGATFQIIAYGQTAGGFDRTSAFATFPEGLLCDPNTAVTWTVGNIASGTAGFTAVYDIVY
jgi:hypothetical protein